MQHCGGRSCWLVPSNLRHNSWGQPPEVMSILNSIVRIWTKSFFPSPQMRSSTDTGSHEHSISSIHNAGQVGSCKTFKSILQWERPARCDTRIGRLHTPRFMQLGFADPESANFFEVLFASCGRDRHGICRTRYADRFSHSLG